MLACCRPACTAMQQCIRSAACAAVLAPPFLLPVADATPEGPTLLAAELAGPLCCNLFPAQMPL